MRAILLALSAVVAVSYPVIASAADRYSVNLTRKDKNLYRVDGQRFWVQTRYCYTYAYGGEAALNDFEVIFLDSGDKCDVKRVLKETQVPAGTYNVSLTHEDDNLYSTLDGMFVRTSMCLALAMSEEAVIRVTSYGTGTVVFLDDNQKCRVENFFSKVRL